MHKEPEGTLVTSVGTVNYVMTQADHVYLRTESATDQAITVYGVRYHVGFHCYLIDGQWKAKDCHEPYLSRKGPGEASNAARKKARQVLSDAWTGYLAGCPGLTRRAALARADSDITKLEEELATLEENTAAKRGELEAARMRRSTL